LHKLKIISYQVDPYRVLEKKKFENIKMNLLDWFDLGFCFPLS